jgi:hypothetical protein
VPRQEPIERAAVPGADLLQQPKRLRLLGPVLVHLPLLPCYLRFLDIVDTPLVKRKGQAAGAGVGTGPTPATTEG